MDCIVHGILQVRILEWAAIPFSRGSSQPRDWTQVSHMGLPYYRQIHYQLNHQRSPRILERVTYPFSRGFFLTQEWTGVTCIAGGFFTSWATREAPPPFFLFWIKFCITLMPSSHRILCRPLLLLLPIPPSIRVFSNVSTFHIRLSKYWSFSFSISPSNEHPGLISFRMDWLDLLAVQGTLKSILQHHSSKASILQRSAFFTV